jgi:hypothetical protein
MKIFECFIILFELHITHSNLIRQLGIIIRLVIGHIKVRYRQLIFPHGEVIRTNVKVR